MTACHRFDPTILREYDIRGIAGSPHQAAEGPAQGAGIAIVIAGLALFMWIGTKKARGPDES